MLPAPPLQEMKLVFPNSQRINRGGMVLSELVEMCRSHDFTDIVIVHEHRGEPGEGSQGQDSRHDQYTPIMAGTRR